MTRAWPWVLFGVVGALLTALWLWPAPGPPDDPSAFYRAKLEARDRVYRARQDSIAGEVARWKAQSAIDAQRARQSLAKADSLVALVRAGGRPELDTTLPCDSALGLVAGQRDSALLAADTAKAAAVRSLVALRGAQLAANAALFGRSVAEGQLSWERQQWEDERADWRRTVARERRRGNLYKAAGGGVTVLLLVVATVALAN